MTLKRVTATGTLSYTPRDLKLAIITLSMDERESIVYIADPGTHWHADLTQRIRLEGVSNLHPGYWHPVQKYFIPADAHGAEFSSQSLPGGEVPLNVRVFKTPLIECYIADKIIDLSDRIRE